MKIKPGDRVRVKTKSGDGTATVVGIDPRSGTYEVHFDRVTVDDGGKKVTHEGVGGYAPGGSIRRE